MYQIERLRATAKEVVYKKVKMHHLLTSQIQREVLLATLGYEGDFIARATSSKEAFECTELAKLQLPPSEVEFINRLVRNGHRFADFFEFLQSRSSQINCIDDDEVAVYAMVLNELVGSYEEKVAKVEQDLRKDPALRWGFVSIQLASAVEECNWIRIMHDILSCCIHKGTFILDFINDCSPASRSSHIVIDDLKRRTCQRFFRKITHFLQYGTSLPCRISSKFLSKRGRHQLEFIGQCIHQFKIIYIPLNLSCIENDNRLKSGDFESFELTLNALYQEYNEYLFEICQEDFQSDVSYLDSVLLVNSVSYTNSSDTSKTTDEKNVIDYFIPQSPILTSKHLQKYKLIYAFLKKIDNAINLVNDHFGKEFSPYRMKVMITLNQVQLFQKTLITNKGMKQSINSYASLVSSLDNELYIISTKLKVLGGILSDFFVKLPNKVHLSDYHRLYHSLLQHSSEYGCAHDLYGLDDLALSLNWNGWMESDTY